MGLQAVPPEPCLRCGGEVRLRLEPDGPVLIGTCSACPEREETLLRPVPAARETLVEVAAARTARLADLRPARPVARVWIPRPRPGDRSPEALALVDAAVMIRERLVAPDPLIHLRTDPFPGAPEDLPVSADGPADYTLLVAADPLSLERALALVGPALPAARSAVIATPEAGNGTDLPRHDRLKPLTAPNDAPGGLFDEISRLLSCFRRAAIWHELDPQATGCDPLFPEGPRVARMMAFTDDLSAYLLALVDRLPPSRPEEFLEAAGGRAALRGRLTLLGIGGLVEIWPDLVRLGKAGEEALPAVVSRRREDAPPTPSLARLFEEAREGSQRARQRLLREGGEIARRIASHRLGPVLRRRVDSEDISQSVVKDLLIGLDDFEFRGEPAWRSYLRRLVENKIRAKADYYGAERRNLRREESLSSGSPEPPADVPGPAETAARREEFRRLAGALERLREVEREVLVLRVFEGLGHREIARRLGRASEGKIHKIYARALARLAEILGEEE